MKKAVPFLILLLSVLMTLSSREYVIEDYSFDITGSTKEWALRRTVDPGGSEKFSSFEELESAVREKVRELNNRRAFRSVEYSLCEREDGDTIFVTVCFTVVDAKTMMIIPYGKYDSNEGLLAAVRGSDQNILGLLGSVESTATVVFPPEGIERTYLEGNMTIRRMPIGESSLYFHYDGSTKSGNFSSKIVFDNVPLFSSSFDTSFQIVRKEEKIKYAYALLFKANAGNISLRPYFEMVFNDDKDMSHILSQFEIGNIRSGNVSLSFLTYYKLEAPSGDSFRSSKVSHTTRLSFPDGVISPFSYENTLRYVFSSYFDVDNTLSWKFSDETTFHMAENIRFYENGILRSDKGIGISEKFDIGSFSITPTLMEYLRTERNGEGFSFRHYFTLSATAEKNTIEWQNTFRRGSKWNITIRQSWFQNYLSRSINSEDGLYDRVEISTHSIVNDSFNPSLRFILSVTDDMEEYGSLGDSHGEYIRGVRNSTVTADGRDSNALTAVLNAEFLFRLPSPEWGSLFLNPFVDVLFTRHDEIAGGRGWLGFGIELIGVLTDYPAYPFRLSVGIDSEKLLKHIRGGSGNGDWSEIFIGTDFFFE